MNPRVFLTLLASSFLLTGCVSRQSEVATKLFGYKKSVKVEAGPYQLHYAHEGTNDFLLLAHGNQDVFSRWTGEGTDVYLDGEPFIHFQRSADGSVTNFTMRILGKDGKTRFSLIDRNADGQWDVKIDDTTGKIYVWKDGGWVQH